MHSQVDRNENHIVCKQIYFAGPPTYTVVTSLHQLEVKEGAHGICPAMTVTVGMLSDEIEVEINNLIIKPLKSRKTGHISSSDLDVVLV